MTEYMSSAHYVLFYSEKFTENVIQYYVSQIITTLNKTETKFFL